MSSPEMSQPTKRRKLTQTCLSGQKTSQCSGSSAGKVGSGLPVQDDMPQQPSNQAKSSAQKLYPMFRPKRERKVVHLVRHGQSEYNAAMFAQGDPRIVDAPLTKQGQEQACRLEADLRKLRLPSDTLWVSSPLTRALHTLRLSCWHLHAAAPPDLANFRVLREIAEHLGTFGDIGRPASVLRQDFAQLAPLMASLPEQWWYAPAANPDASCPYLKSEPMSAVKERCGQFRKWLEEQPQKVIVVVGHSTFWKVFTSSPHRLKNCEVQTIMI
ncbi:hypothetical protein WJX84_001003 [Apatococcus fuscideae]|uniref:Phosphoglycerate mutase-like protein n=1 Tax=Apatococcus fuscideae TaxID=2026836 RepID=A0AAW1TCA2_9CHLO